MEALISQATTQKPQLVEESNQARASISAHHVTKLNQLNIVKLEPIVGLTLFLNQTTTDCSITITTIRIQYCVSRTTRTDTTARKGPIQGQQHNIKKQAPRNGKQYTKRH